LQKKTTNSEKEEPSDLQKIAKSYRTGWAHAEVAFQYGAAIIICTLIGYWIDNRLDTDWIFTVIGMFIGSTAGFILLLKTLKVLNFGKKKDNKN
jgi:F0F1-type ATP synthase assembly protein I